MKAIIRNVAVMVTVLAAARCFAESEPPSQVPDKYDHPLGNFKQSQAKAGMEVTFISKSTRESLGVSTDGGAVVERVEKDGPADKATLKNRDVIISICGVMISSQKNFNYALNKAYIENCNAIPVTVIRSGTIEALTMRIPGPPRTNTTNPKSANNDEAWTWHRSWMPDSHKYRFLVPRHWGWDHLTFGPMEIGAGALLPLAGMVMIGWIGTDIPLTREMIGDWIPNAPNWVLVPVTTPVCAVAGTIVGTGLGGVVMGQGLFNILTFGSYAKGPFSGVFLDIDEIMAMRL